MKCQMCGQLEARENSEFCASCARKMDRELAIDRVNAHYDYEEGRLTNDEGFSNRIHNDFSDGEIRAFLRAEGKERVKRERRENRG